MPKPHEPETLKPKRMLSNAAALCSWLEPSRRGDRGLANWFVQAAASDRGFAQTSKESKVRRTVMWDCSDVCCVVALP